MSDTKTPSPRPTRWLAFANWVQGDGISGGDTILMNLISRWNKEFDTSFELVTSESGKIIYTRGPLQESERFKIRVISSKKMEKLPALFLYAIRTFTSIKTAATVDFSQYDYVYSSSDFWPDMIAGLILKWRYPKIQWIGSVYLFAPNPFYGFIMGDKLKLKFPKMRQLFYYLTQKLAVPLIKRFADKVCVISEYDKAKLGTPRCGDDNVVIVMGGVDIDDKREYLTSGAYKNQDKIYDACFMGRFHPQKGPVEVVDIWKRLVEKRPNAKLLMIGSGPLEPEVRARIKKYGLSENITLAGTKLGKEKDDLCRKAKIALHPSVYDSGGVAVVEVMALGLPAVAFDLDAYGSYYPKGMITAEKQNFGDFADKIDMLLSDEKAYGTYQEEAVELVTGMWDYKRRAEILYNKMR